jgi:hypothetical protein
VGNFMALIVELTRKPPELEEPMPTLSSDLRRQLENVVVQARDLAEAAARASLKRRAVDAAEPFEHFSAADKAFRNRLRPRGRQARDKRDERSETQQINQLAEDFAYEYWHRMPFARFLAENNLDLPVAGDQGFQEPGNDVRHDVGLALEKRAESRKNAHCAFHKRAMRVYSVFSG